MDVIEKYLQLILEANETTNLTRIESLESARVLHIEDSLYGLKYLEEAPAGRYGDMGTGGGFPGVPLAVKSGRETLLIDSVKKKVAILAGIVEQLGLSDQIGTYGGRIEELAIEQPASFSALTARALSQLASLMELASPLLCEGGLLICYKAQATEEEVSLALSLCDKLGFALLHDDSFVLSDGVTTRRIIVFEKTHEARIALPRRVGMAQKKPLKP